MSLCYFLSCFSSKMSTAVYVRYMLELRNVCCVCEIFLPASVFNALLAVAATGMSSSLM